MGDTSSKQQEKKEAVETHGQGAMDARPCVMGSSRMCLRREEKWKGMDVCLDRLSYDLDTEFTTKSRLRALKLT